MVKIRGCANCSKPAAESSTLCVDCLFVCHTKLRERMISLDVENRRNLTNLAVIVKEQKEQIRELEYQLKLRMKLLQKIFTAYQEVMRDRRRDKIKIDSINRMFR